jgi:DNA-binding NarL/FixJ family response regulator
VRAGVRALLSAEPDIRVVGEASDGEEAVRLASDLRPDIILMDIRLPGIDGIEATRRIKSTLERTDILVLSAYEDDETVLQAIQAGARGYVLKDITPENLVRATRAVRAGMSTVHPSVARRLFDRISQMGRRHGAAGRPMHSDGLTGREVEILVGLASGAGSRELAARLSVSESTIKSHLRTIYRKIRVRDRSQAVAYAIRKGFVR